MKKYIISLLIVQICLTGCAHANKDSLIKREDSARSIFNSSRQHVEHTIGVTLEDYYSIYIEGNKFLGARYDYHLFIFKNNRLLNVVDYFEVVTIWDEELVFERGKLPYVDRLETIQERINQLPLYTPTTKKGGLLSGGEPGDGAAAILMLAIAAPILPVALFESKKEVEGVEIDWDSEIIGQSYETVIRKLGRPVVERNYNDENKIIGFKQKYSKVPHYVGIKHNKTVWVIHLSHN